MRTFLIRGAMITFFAVTGLFGSAATVQFDGLEANVQTNSAEARYRVDPGCTPPLLIIYEDHDVRFKCGEQ